MTEREHTPGSPRHRAAGTAKRRRPADLTLLRGEGIPAARPRPLPNDPEWEEIVRELRAACREIREAVQRLRRWLQEGCPQPGPGRGPGGRAPRRAG